MLALRTDERNRVGLSPVISGTTIGLKIRNARNGCQNAPVPVAHSEQSVLRVSLGSVS
jgi:hypothetical protein